MGEPTIQELIGHDQLYDFSYKYVENEVSARPQVIAVNTWPLPNSENYLFDKLNRDWAAKKVPLHISLKDGRVLIAHQTYPVTGKVAQLQLAGNLAYTLGYIHEIRDPGQFLRFDENGEYHAPHEPKSFVSYLNKNLSKTLEMMKIDSPNDIKFFIENINKQKQHAQRKLLHILMGAILRISLLQEKSKQEHVKEIAAIQAKNDEKWKEIMDKLENHDYEMVACQVGKEDALNDLRRFYEMRMDEMKKDQESFLNESTLKYESYAEDLKIEIEKGKMDLDTMLKEDEMEVDRDLSDCRDRVDNNITSIANFEDEMTLAKWTLKGIVLKGEEVDLGNEESIYVMTLKDHSGEIEIAAFGKYGKVLKDLSQHGKEYYIEKIESLTDDLYQDGVDDQSEASVNNLRVGIANKSFRVKVEEIM